MLMCKEMCSVQALFSIVLTMNVEETNLKCSCFVVFVMYCQKTACACLWYHLKNLMKVQRFNILTILTSTQLIFTILTILQVWYKML